MKNKFIIILTILFIFLPIRINAASIKSTSAVGLSSVEVGEEIKVKFYINFDGVDKNDKESLGIYELAYEIMYDPSVLELKTIYSSGFNSFVFEENGAYFAYSILQKNIPSTVRCSDGVLFCSSYMMEATFKALNNSKETTEVSIGDVEVGVHPMTTDGNVYEDDITYISTSSLATKKIKITKPATNNNTNNNSNNNTNNSTNNKVEKEEKKSSNKYLKELKIKNYEIDFNKNENNYTITIPKDINSLEIEATPEDEKSTVTINGNDDLKKYNDKIFIVVTSEDGSTNTYTISVTYTEENEEVVEEVEKIEEKDSFKLTKDQILLIGIALGIILIIFIIIIIVVKINDRKIDKALDEL